MNEEKWIAWKMQTSTAWSDIEDVLKYINIDFIDYDHKLLVEYALKLNTVIDRLEESFSLELLSETKILMTDLYDYAVFHFDREELFMDQYHLPGIDKHKLEHQRILGMLKNALNDFNNGKIKVSQQLKEQVMDWLIKHINIIDFAYFDIENWSKNLVNASDWNQVKAIIRLTGIKDIDEQHQYFTSMAIEIMETCTTTNDPDIIRSEFKRFKDYAIFHFDYEQNFMKKFGITETEEHLRLHAYFLDQLDIFPEQIIESPESLVGLKSWILKWWISHINETDKETFVYKKWAYKLIETAKSLEDVDFLLRRTHITEIDNDHLHLMEVTLRLNQVIENYIKEGVDLRKPEVKAEIKLLFNQIYDIAFDHFEHEKKIMKAHQLKDAKRHLEEHRLILKRFNDIKNNYLEDRLYLSGNIKTMILEWWIEHTNTVDFTTFVQNFREEDSLFMEGGWRL